MNIKDIIDGHIKEIKDENVDLFNNRMSICKKCPLYKETTFGPICNGSLYINKEDKESISNVPRIGFTKGCGCRLNAKTRLKHARCIINK